MYNSAGSADSHPLASIRTFRVRMMCSPARVAFARCGHLSAIDADCIKCVSHSNLRTLPKDARKPMESHHQLRNCSHCRSRSVYWCEYVRINCRVVRPTNTEARSIGMYSRMYGDETSEPTENCPPRIINNSIVSF